MFFAIFAQAQGVSEAKETKPNLVKAALKGWQMRLGGGLSLGGTSPLPIPAEIRAIDSYDPTLCIDKHPISDVTVYEEEFLTKLKEPVADMYSPDAAFTPTDDRKKCELCPYRMLCGL